MATPLRIALSACEPSADHLGADLIKAVRKYRENVSFTGVAGPEMRRQGCEAIIETEQLSVMGIIEIMGRLPALLGFRRKLTRYFLDNPPDIFIGIDAPDFNLGMEYRLKQAGIPTIHYVSPSIWAWRRWRINRIAKCTDLLLTLFPFEKAIYQKHNIAVEFTGHPLADQIPAKTDKTGARRELSLDAEQVCIALLPGSRSNEVERLLPVLIATAQLCQKERPGMQFVIPAATAALFSYINLQLENANCNIRVIEGCAQTAMISADVCLVASGTATLECLLVNRPMVVVYKMNPLSFTLINSMLLSPYVSLPNYLAGHKLVPEYLQGEVKPNILRKELFTLLDDPCQSAKQTDRFDSIHEQLAQDASNKAAQYVLKQWETDATTIN